MERANWLLIVNYHLEEEVEFVSLIYLFII